MEAGGGIHQQRSAIEVHRQSLDEDTDVIGFDAQETYREREGISSASRGISSYSTREYQDQLKGRGTRQAEEEEVEVGEEEERRATFQDTEEAVGGGRGGGIVDYATCEQTTFRLPAWLVCLLTYGLLLLGGVVVAVYEKKSYYACFHGFQSFMLNVLWMPILVACLLGDILLNQAYGVFFLSFVALGILFSISFLCAVFAVWRAPDGSLFQLPLLGSIALKLADKSFDHI